MKPSKKQSKAKSSKQVIAQSRQQSAVPANQPGVATAIPPDIMQAKQAESSLPLQRQLAGLLPISESFDVVERTVVIGGRSAWLYFVDGFIKDEVMQRILTDFFKITESQLQQLPGAEEFSRAAVPYVEVVAEASPQKAADAVLAGQTALYIQGFDRFLLLDLRTYPTRSIDEPEKEETLRGSRDGLVETLVFNTALIRRRLRDSRLTFSIQSIGRSSKADVCIGYMDGVADPQLIALMKRKLQRLSDSTDSLSAGDQSLVELLTAAEGKKASALNPFPKVRYTERPDVAAAHLTEGKIVILVDNSPTAMILPTGLFDFLQDSDDYSFPPITGNYFRLVRNLTGFSTLLLTPLYLLLVQGFGGVLLNFWMRAEAAVSGSTGAIATTGSLAELLSVPASESPFHWQWLDALNFLLPQEEYVIPLFFQFLLLELSIDALKLASLNTPSSLGMSLSVIGALILGEFSVSSGWLIPQAILLMAVVALAGFSQPSIELSFAVKFMRLLLLCASYLFGWYGLAAMLLLEFLLLLHTKTVTETSYLYPLIPFDGKKLLELLFRTRKKMPHAGGTQK